jgi:hypothetical protein
VASALVVADAVGLLPQSEPTEDAPPGQLRGDRDGGDATGQHLEDHAAGAGIEISEHGESLVGAAGFEPAFLCDPNAAL